MILVAVDVVGNPPSLHESPESMKHGKFIAEKFVDAGGGYEALVTTDGHVVGWTPDNGGEFHFNATAVSDYEKCKRSGQIVSWKGCGILVVRSWAEA